MLFFGNSYTFYNELDQRVAELYAAAGETVAAERVANGGWTFVDHLEAVETPGTPSADALARPHDWVVLQEQSQIPGFRQNDPDLQASVAAAVALDTHAGAAGAGTVFLMTWGRRDGDADNPDIYPDFSTMNDRLDAGYLAYAAAAGEDGSPAWVAPAGRAWARVYDDVLAAGEDPLAEGSAFHALYDVDGSHPSPRGSFLAACVIYTSLTGASAEGLGAPAGVPDGDYLAAVAADVVLGAEDLVYPWSSGGPGDTGATDTGTADTGPGDTGGDGGDPDDSGPADDGPPDEAPPADAGCGCAGGGGSGPLLPAVVALLLRRRATRG